MPNKIILRKSHLYVLILILIGILTMHYCGGIWQSAGVPICLIALMAFFINRLRRHKSFSHVSASLDKKKMSPPVLQQAQKTVDEQISDPAIAVIGTEYRRNQQKEFEHTIDDLLDTCIKLLHAHLDCHTVAVFFPGTNGGYCIRRYLSKGENINDDAIIQPGKGVIGSFLKNGLKELKLSDIITDSKTLYYYNVDAGIKSLIASPIIADGHDRGIIIVDSTKKDGFTDNDHTYLTSMANLGGQSVFNSYMYNQHRLNHERLTAMSNTEKYFFKEQNINAVLDKLIEIIPFAFQCNRLTISLLDDEEPDIATIKRAYGEHIEELENLIFSINDKSLANILYSKHLCFFRNFSTEHYEIRHNDKELQHEGFKSFIAFPIGVEKSKGMILLESFRSNAYAETARDLLSCLISSAGLAIEKIQILKQTENLAIRDGLTGLYNHRQFQHLLKEAITRTIRVRKPLALVICDIDHFKNVNDTYGHSFGDTVLKTIAAKLQSSIREGVDNSARYGGEEFALILAETDANSAIDTVDRIRTQISEMMFQSPLGNEMNCTMSFGIAIYGKHAKNQELLIKRADKALYKAKDNGRNRVELYYMKSE